MTNYARGASFEYRVRDYLRGMGYFVVRSAGSHGCVDLVAMKAGDILLVQCKRHGRLPKDEREALKAAVIQCGGVHTYAVHALLDGRKIVLEWL